MLAWVEGGFFREPCGEDLGVADAGGDWGEGGMVKWPGVAGVRR